MIDPAAEDAAKALADGAPIVLLHGRAGTGKSHFIRHVATQGQKAPPALLAPTGLAAMQIGGQTIHSFFGFPPRPLLGFNEKPNWFFSKAARGLRRLIVDEISMLRADMLDAMDRQLQAARRSPKPFGGVQVLLVGDFHQLPPVVRGDEGRLLAEAGYESPFAFSAQALRQNPVDIFELTTVRRQTDPEFIALLGAVRDGSRLEATLDALNGACVNNMLDHAPVLLASTNVIADEHNRRGLAALSGETRLFTGGFKGARAPKTPPTGDRLPAPMELALRVGARVIFTQNDSEGRWVNGSLGVVIAFEDKTILVRLDQNRQTVEVGLAKWPQAKWSWNDKTNALEVQEEWAYEQYPLAHAWAITIHKAQGMTLDHVEIDLGRGAFAAGQTYVALSRARSMAGLRLARPLRLRDIQVDPAIADGLARLK